MNSSPANPTAVYRLPPEPAAVGAQGRVYFTNAPSGAPLAVKVSSGGQVADRAMETEVAALRALQSAGVQGVMQCLDAPRIEGRPALVMHRYPGHLGDWLTDALANPGSSTLRVALKHSAALARVLGDVHKVTVKGGTIVHRDVKPENVFIDANGDLLLGDFGCAMTIDGLSAVELALYGTPMWAPLDQVLPGQAIPDPTWDTYALCVFLYAAITGARPAYQADPRELLTKRGNTLWSLAKAAIETRGEQRQALAKEFAEKRVGTRADQLVDCTGRAALNDADRTVLIEGVTRLGATAGLPPETITKVHRSLWRLLVRGLSPLSHPSPPNRFRDGHELAELLDDLGELVQGPSSAVLPSPELSRRFQTADINIDITDEVDVDGGDAAPRSSLGGRTAPLVVMSLVVGAGLVGLGWMDELSLRPLTTLLPQSDRVTIPSRAVALGEQTIEVPGFQLDRVELTADTWHDCVADGACAEIPQLTRGRQPMIGLGLDDANAVCEWKKARLPSRVEWLSAAGTERWPWGSTTPNCQHATAMGCDLDLPIAAGTTLEGATQEGALDMAGNAWEWAIDGEGGVLLGGSVGSGATELGRHGLYQPEPGQRPRFAGVRCAWDPT